MPLVKIYVRDNKMTPEDSRDRRRRSRGARRQANVPADDRFQILNRLDRDLIVAHPSYGGVSRSEDIVIIEITLNAGRTVEVKKTCMPTSPCGWNAWSQARRRLVSLIEVTKENWSFGGGRATYA